MHLFFYIRGVPQFEAMFKSFMQSQFWKWDRINLETGKKETLLVQGALRSSVLGAYEYIFPEECLAEVLALFGLEEGRTGAEKSTANYLKLGILRKIFGAEKIPKEAFKQAKKIPTSILVKGSMRGLSAVMTEFVTIHTIGIRKDRREKNKKLGYEQEMI